MSVHFHSNDISFTLRKKLAYKKWIKEEVERRSYCLGEVNIIFCNDNYILDINRNYLQHDYFTDNITFNNNEEKLISGDLFISVDRVKENAATYSVTTDSEIKRVIIHGILHLLGYNDHSPSQKTEIRKQEDAAINRFPVS